MRMTIARGKHSRKSQSRTKLGGLTVMAMVIAFAMSTMAGAFANSTIPDAEILSPTDGGIYYLAPDAQERSILLKAETAPDHEFAYAVRTASEGIEDYDYDSCLSSGSENLFFAGGGLFTDEDGLWESTVDLGTGTYCFVFNGNPGPADVGEDYRPVVTFHVGVADSKDACKDGGWETFGDYRNQGQCVSYFASDGRSAK